jgi:hypothetical protein
MPAVLRRTKFNSLIGFASGFSIMMEYEISQIITVSYA